MSELEYPQNSSQWAWEKGLKRKCQKHGIEYDPNIGCKKCHEEAKEREEKKRKLKEAFNRIIWPDK